MNPRPPALPPFEVQRPTPVAFDHCLRYWVWSRTVFGKKYLVQLDSFDFNGECQCKNFTVHKGPLLKRAVTPAAAVAEGLIKLKDGQNPANALRCHHIVDAFVQFGEDAARTFSHVEKKNALASRS